MNPAFSPLDRFLPAPDVRERFAMVVRAPADLVLDVACGFDMQSRPSIRAIFRMREGLLRSARGAPRVPRGILAETQALGWGILEERKGRLVVCGARCQPWLPDVKFTALAADEFAAYAVPDEVKIAWTLETEPTAPAITRFVQETRAVATDARARRKFRRYWRWARFGIITIRLLLMPAIRDAAERRWNAEQQR